MCQLKLYSIAMLRAGHVAVISCWVWKRVISALCVRGFALYKGLDLVIMQNADPKRALNMQYAQKEKIHAHYIKSLKVSLSFGHYNESRCETNLWGLK